MTSTPNLSVYIATSLDGFIARPNGEIDWLTRPDAAIEGEDFGYQAFMNTVDVMVMGRHTYETVLGFGGDWPYAGKHMFVLSSAQPAVPESLTGQVEVVNRTPAEMVQLLQERGFKHAYVDGGKTIQAFLRAGLIHELTITHIPVLLGEGIPLFGVAGRDITLTHTGTTAYSNGFVQSRYSLSPTAL